MSHEQELYQAAGQASDLLRAYQRSGQLSLLVTSVQLLRDVVSVMPADHPGSAGRLSNLSVALLALFERTGDSTALTEAIQAGRQAVAATPADHPWRAARLANLGNAWQALFERTGDSTALTEAIQAVRQAVTATPADHPDHVVILNNLGNALRLNFNATGDEDSLAEAIAAGRQVVAAAPADHPNRAAFLNNLGLALRSMAERTGDSDLAAEAVQAGRAAVASFPADHPYRPAFLDNLGAALQAVFRWTGDTEALAEAITTGREAIAATSPGDPDLAGRTRSLEHALLAQFDRTRDTALLAEVVQMARDALTATPRDHPQLADRLNDLAVALQTLFLWSRDTTVLAEAIRASRDGAAAVPDDHPDRAAILGNLANSMRMLSEQSGDADALREAAALAREAGAARAGHRNLDRTTSQGALAGTLLALYRRTGDSETLAEALSAAREAVAAAATKHPERWAVLNLLGVVLRTRSDETDDASILLEAIQVGREAVAVADGINRLSALSNLGISLQSLFTRSKDMTVLMEAVDVGREAVAATPDDDPELIRRLDSLGFALWMAAERTGSKETLAEAFSMFQKAGRLDLASASNRVSALTDAAVIADRLGADPATAMGLMEEAVRLLPQLAPRALARADREHELGRLSLVSGEGSLAGIAAAAAVAAGRPTRAVELLEQTRGVLVADTVNARSSDLSRLRSSAPDLADAFDRLRRQLDALDLPDVAAPGVAAIAAGPEGAIGVERLVLARQDAQKAWNDLLAQIRKRDGLGGFLLPPRIQDLALEAREGPIVFLTTSATQSYALIVTDHPAEPVQALPLTSLSADDVTNRLDQLIAARNAALDPPGGNPFMRPVAQATIFDIFRWLWDTVTEPVLDTLGYTRNPGETDEWPRVWWCPTGFLTLLPIHAAGYHTDLSDDDPQRRMNPRTVLDRVVSSYTTTLRGLGYARAHHHALDGSSTVIVAVPDAPGAARLPGADAEADAIAELIPGAHRPPHPVRDTVLRELPVHRIAHFACHAVSDWADPAASRLILPDHLVRSTTVADLSALRIDGSLAFLSACDTATSGPTLADEAVHIVGAFHLAGYRHVIGALWPVADRIALRLVKDFYTELTADGTAPPDVDRSAVALHHATRRLRGRFLASPAHWAAYAHTGA